jgi:hypothetical protein
MLIDCSQPPSLSHLYQALSWLIAANGVIAFAFLMVQEVALELEERPV